MSTAAAHRADQHEQVRTAPPAGDRGTAGSRRQLPRWASARCGRCWSGRGRTVLAVLIAGGQPHDGALDPENPRPDGARAVARVLDQRGVHVDVVRSQAELLRQDLDGATLVVPDSQQLSGRNGQAALRAAARATDVVLLSPAQDLLADLALPRTDRPGEPPTRCEADCTGGGGPGSAPGLTLSEVDRVVTATPAATGATTCFRDADGQPLGASAVHGRPPAGDGRRRAALPHQRRRHRRRQRRRGPAPARAVRPPGLVRPDGPRTSRPTTPPSRRRSHRRGCSPRCGSSGRRCSPSACGAVAASAGSWSNRCRSWCGPSRPPRAVAGSTAGPATASRAVAVLQAATTRRLTSYLGLATGTDVSAVAAAAASVSGRRYDDVLRLLGPATVPDDASMLELATTLAALEKEVRRR